MSPKGQNHSLVLIISNYCLPDNEDVRVEPLWPLPLMRSPRATERFRALPPPNNSKAKGRPAPPLFWSVVCNGCGTGRCRKLSLSHPAKNLCSAGCPRFVTIRERYAGGAGWELEGGDLGSGRCIARCVCGGSRKQDLVDGWLGLQALPDQDPSKSGTSPSSGVGAVYTCPSTILHK